MNTCFARLDILYRVIKIVVADQDFVDRQPGMWVPVDMDGLDPKNYPGIGYTYDPVNNAYIAPKPYPSWTLDANYKWQPPAAFPDDGKAHEWSEETQAWL